MTHNLIGFDYQPRTRLIFGVHCIERLGQIAHDIGARKVLLVTDPGLVTAGHAQCCIELLEASGLSVVVFDGVIENPTTREVDACVEVARASGIDTLIGLGGGSSMDTAKGCNFLLTNGGQMQDYVGIGKATKDMLPLIAIPTTAGTGSECQSFALISDEVTHLKMACGDYRAAARVAILDPALTVTQPRQVAAVTGIDALAHALESAVTKKRNEMSLLFSREAFRMLQSNLPRVLEEPNDLEARGYMQLGAAFAGTAIENSMLGAAHSAANPLTAHYGTVHGNAVGMMLPYVMRFNAEDEAALKTYAELAVLAGLAQSNDSSRYALDALLDRLDTLLRVAEVPLSISAYNVPPADISTLAQEAAAQWTATFNPRSIAAADFQKLYEYALA